MGKAKAPRRLADNEARAVLRTIRISPQKLNLVAAADPRHEGRRRRSNDLEFSRKRIAGDVKKTLKSAIANAENNHNLDIDALVVAEAYVGKTIVMKRFHARARGRAGRIEKPFSQLTIVVREVERGGRLMGQKVNPIGLRLGINRTWDSRWFANTGEYGKLLHEDIKIREYLKKELKQAGGLEDHHRASAQEVPRHDPRRPSGRVIGKKGADIEKLRKKLTAMTEVGGAPEHRRGAQARDRRRRWSPQTIAQQLERRVAFRRAMKRAVQSAMRLGAEGIRINASGRLGGAEIARMEWYREGRVPLHTLRADIDYGFAEAKTAYGIIGVKVWVFKGEILEHDPMASTSAGRPKAIPPAKRRP